MTRAGSPADTLIDSRTRRSPVLLMVHFCPRSCAVSTIFKTAGGGGFHKGLSFTSCRAYLSYRCSNLLPVACSDEAATTDQDADSATDAASETDGGILSDADDLVDTQQDDLSDGTSSDGDDLPGDVSSDTQDVVEEAHPDSADADASDVCVPDCGDRVCGPDPVCGTSCGECSGGKTCVEGQCRFTLYPGTCSETTLTDNTNDEVWDSRSVVTNRYSSGAVLLQSRTEDFPGTGESVLNPNPNPLDVGSP